MLKAIRVWNPMTGVSGEYSQEEYFMSTSSLLTKANKEDPTELGISIEVGFLIHPKTEKVVFENDIYLEEEETDEGDIRHYYVIKWLDEVCGFVFMNFGDLTIDWSVEETLDYPTPVLGSDIEKMILVGNYNKNPELLLK